MQFLPPFLLRRGCPLPLSTARPHPWPVGDAARRAPPPPLPITLLPPPTAPSLACCTLPLIRQLPPSPPPPNACGGALHQRIGEPAAPPSGGASPPPLCLSLRRLRSRPPAPHAVCGWRWGVGRGWRRQKGAGVPAAAPDAGGAGGGGGSGRSCAPPHSHGVVEPGLPQIGHFSEEQPMRTRLLLGLNNDCSLAISPTPSFPLAETLLNGTVVVYVHVGHLSGTCHCGRDSALCEAWSPRGVLGAGAPVSTLASTGAAAA